MKKQILSIVLMVVAYAGLNAQILTDNIDSYDLGAIGPQADHWTTWSGTEGGTEDGIVSATQSNSPDNSMYIGNNGAQDVVLLLGDSATGAYNLSWNMYVPADSTGYYNFQGQPAIGTDYVIEIYLAGGTISFGGADAPDTAIYPEGEWFEIKHQIDLDADILNILINGVGVYSGAYTGTSGNLSSIDFFSAANTNAYYIDDINLDTYMSCPVPGALICDNFEAYDLDAEYIGPQSSIWTTWSGDEGTVEDGLISDEYANSGSQCLLIEEGGDQDVILLLGDYETGRYSLSWDVLLEDESTTGFYNFQGAPEIGTLFILQCFFNEGGMAGDTASFDNTDDTYVYPFEEWFHLEHIVDLDNDIMYILFNGTVVTSVPYVGNLSSIDFFSIDENNRMYIDDVVLVALDAVVACDPTNVLYCDNFDLYSAGSTLGQWSEQWSTWSGNLGTAEDGIISSEQANSGANSMLIAEGGSQDVVLLLGDSTSGIYDLSWDMYVPDNASGYYNFQGDPTIGTSYVLEVYLNDGGNAPGVIAFGATGSTDIATYPMGEWFNIKHEINLDLDQIKIYLDGVLAFTGPYTNAAGSNLSSIDFFSISSTNRYFVDNVILEVHPVGISELSNSNITLYPNPNTGSFTLLNDEKAGVYSLNVIDLTGRSIMNQSITMDSGESKSIVLNDVVPGVYLVRLYNEEDTTIKIVKMIVE